MVLMGWGDGWEMVVGVAVVLMVGVVAVRGIVENTFEHFQTCGEEDS